MEHTDLEIFESGSYGRNILDFEQKALAARGTPLAGRIDSLVENYKDIAAKEMIESDQEPEQALVDFLQRPSREIDDIRLEHARRLGDPRFSDQDISRPEMWAAIRDEVSPERIDEMIQNRDWNNPAEYFAYVTVADDVRSQNDDMQALMDTASQGVLGKMRQVYDTQGPEALQAFMQTPFPDDPDARGDLFDDIHQEGIEYNRSLEEQATLEHTPDDPEAEDGHDYTGSAAALSR